MNFQDFLLKLSEYNVNVKVDDGKFAVSVKYNPDWSIVKSEDSDIKIYRSKNPVDKYIYVTSTDGKGDNLEKIFDCINATITYNKDLEAKMQLFKVKMVELQEVFAKSSAEDLKRLEFVIPPPVKKRVKKSASKKETVKKASSKKPVKKQQEPVKAETENPIALVPKTEPVISEVDKKIETAMMNKMN